MATLSTLSKLNIRPLLKLNDELRKLASSESDINVPSIVAVGDQSHGKSSVIEALSGVDLPRGEGIQTRVPLLLMLRCLESKDEKEYAVIKAEGLDEKTISLTNIPDAVREYTDLMAGAEGKDVVMKELELVVFRHDQDDLTLIDLPGMTRVALKGQNPKIEETITEMYKKYMEPEETILLNVVSAMVDFSTSKSLSLSREFDPEGMRTLLCVTKIDQHKEPGLLKKVEEASTNLLLAPEHVFCVRNRSQKENDEALSLSAARDTESAFFESHEELRLLPDNVKSVYALSEKLVILQCERIKETLPKSAAKIRERIKELEGELAKLGSIPTDEVTCRLIQQQQLNKITEDLKDQANGRTRTAFVERDMDNVATLHLDVTSLKNLRRKANVGDNVIEGEAVLCRGQTCYLEFYPVYNKKVEEGHGRSVGVFVTVECAPGVESVEVEYEIKIFDNDGNSLASFHDSDSLCNESVGCREALSEKVADAYDTLSVTCQLIVNKVIGGSSAEKEELLCARLSSAEERFQKKMQEAYPERYFFSDSFHAMVEEEVSARRGSAGLPGAPVPEPAMCILAQLRKKLPRLTNDFLNDYFDIVSKTILDMFDAGMKDYPVLLRTVKKAILAQTTEQKNRAKEFLGQLLACEDVIKTKNHYFMDIVQGVRQKIADTTNNDTRYPFLKQKLASLRKLSNEQQRILDLQVEIFAYWKVMRKRFIDYVFMSVRMYLVNETLTVLQSRIQQETEKEAIRRGGLVELMAPDSRRRRTIEFTKQRLSKLNDATALIEQYEEATLVTVQQ